VKYSYVLARDTERYLSRVDAETQNRVIDRIRILCDFPEDGRFSHALHDHLQDAGPAPSRDCA
jgi:hypothetical protein